MLKLNKNNEDDENDANKDDSDVGKRFMVVFIFSSVDGVKEKIKLPTATTMHKKTTAATDKTKTKVCSRNQRRQP